VPQQLVVLQPLAAVAESQELAERLLKDYIVEKPGLQTPLAHHRTHLALA
jgi:hypothetical protein